MLLIQALAQFSLKKFIKFKDAHGGNAANKTLPGDQKTWKILRGYAQLSPQLNCFLSIAF